MSDATDRYRRLAGELATAVAAVPADRWSSPSPCEGWTALDVVRHVVDTSGMFLGFIGRSLGGIPSVDDDPHAALTAATGAVQAALDEPATAAQTFEGITGTSTFEAAVDRFLSFDLVVHRWDLARATGGDEHIDPDDVRRLTEAAHAFPEGMRGPRAFGPEVEPAPGADDRDRLLAFLGRRP